MVVMHQMHSCRNSYRSIAPSARNSSNTAAASKEASKAATEHRSGGTVDDSLTLRRYMTGASLNNDEQFLRDYVLNAMWKNPAAARQRLACCAACARAR